MSHLNVRKRAFLQRLRFLVLMRGTENADTAKTIRHIRSRSIMLDNFKWQPVGSDSEVLSREDEFSIQFTAKGHPKMFIRLEKPTGAIELKVSDFLVAEDETALAAQVFRYASEAMGIRLSGRRIRATHISTSDLIWKFVRLSTWQRPGSMRFWSV